jgi:hypothetical protein
MRHGLPGFPLPDRQAIFLPVCKQNKNAGGDRILRGKHDNAVIGWIESAPVPSLLNPAGYSAN